MATLRQAVLVFAFTILLGLPFAVAHGIGEPEIENARIEPSAYLPVDPSWLALYDFGLICAIVAASLAFPAALTPKTKKAFFIIIAVPAVLITLYMAASTVYLNVISWSGGPVHWHADFEIWACGEKLALPKATFPSNYVGTSTLHHHDDYRIHVEGLVVSKDDVALRSFFRVIGGDLEKGRLAVPNTDVNSRNALPVLEFNNGDLCPNGKPGKVKLYVKNQETGAFEENPGIDDYVLKPFYNIPPGDYLKIAFETE